MDFWIWTNPTPLTQTLRLRTLPNSSLDWKEKLAEASPKRGGFGKCPQFCRPGRGCQIGEGGRFIFVGGRIDGNGIYFVYFACNHDLVFLIFASAFCIQPLRCYRICFLHFTYLNGGFSEFRFVFFACLPSLERGCHLRGNSNPPFYPKNMDFPQPFQKVIDVLSCFDCQTLYLTLSISPFYFLPPFSAPERPLFFIKKDNHQLSQEMHHQILPRGLLFFYPSDATFFGSLLLQPDTTRLLGRILIPGQDISSPGRPILPNLELKPILITSRIAYYHPPNFNSLWCIIFRKLPYLIFFPFHPSSQQFNHENSQ